MKIFRFPLTAPFCRLLACLALTICLAATAGAGDLRSEDKEELRRFSALFAEIYTEIQNNYAGPIDHKELLEAAINGMFDALDKHSAWLPPVEREILSSQNSGEYSGIGMHMALDEDRRLMVLLPVPGAPAARAGIQSWDRILEIDGEPTSGVSVHDAATHLMGPEGSDVHLKVYRPSLRRNLEFSVERAEIKVESVFSRDLGGGIGYLRISRFQDDTAARVREALEHFNRAKMAGIILDVRNNPGGLVDRVQEIAEMFLHRGQIIVSLKERNPDNSHSVLARRDPLCRQPVVVLINENSASASEILAGAIQDNKRGVVMGAKGSHSYGKASVQTISTLPTSLDRDENGDPLRSGLCLTTAHYYTPSGRQIMNKGITPDIGVEVPEDFNKQLNRHGLLGEPIYEATRQRPAHLDGRPEDVAEAGGERLNLGEEAEAAADAEGTTPVARRKPFRDILLDEARRYLKSTLEFENANRASG